jgi:diguanylate cyclase (GGDEF)-like protein
MNEDKVEKLRNTIIAFVTEEEKVDDVLIKEVDSLVHEKGTFYSKSLGWLIHLNFSEEEAFGHWQKIIKHREALQEKLGKEVPIKLVLLDYFHELNKTSLHPLGLDISIFRLKERLAMVDELTGTFNRRYLDVALTKELKRAQRFNKAVSLIMFSISDLSHFEDVREPLFEIKVLKKIISLIESMMRAEDTLGRFENDKYCFILPEANKEGATTFINRIQEKLKGLPFFSQRHIGLTAGVVSFPQDGTSIADLMRILGVRLAEAQTKSDRETAGTSGHARKQRRLVMTWKVSFEVLEGKEVSDIGTNECFSQEVSLSGLNLETNKEMGQYTKLLLVLKPAIMTDEFIKVIGIVKTVKKISTFKYQYGIEFYDLKEEQISKLKSILPPRQVNP